MPRMSLPVPTCGSRVGLSVFCMFGILIGIAACGGSGVQVMRDQQQLRADIAALRADRAMDCAPAELARAEANLSFALLEMDAGHPNRAREHLEEGTEHARLVREAIDACAPPPTPTPTPPPSDRDGDGIVDEQDQCPDEPEDFDGIEDDDGCPDVPGDRDGDGITDDLDRCPDLPEDIDGVQDEDGCPDETLDRDGDGLADSVDRCPDAPEDADGFEDDDGCPDVDNDGDGVFDVVDRCPMEPEDSDGFEDDDGCPDPDNDHDGIADGDDACPTEAETSNGFEDDDGCPDTKPEVPKHVTITAEQIKIDEQIKFKFNSDEILPVSHAILDDVAKVLESYPNMKIRVEGHTDSVGSEIYNLKLSKRRAAAVRSYLIGVGIDGDRLTSVGLGESQPIDTNETEEGRANNRRVEFHIIER